MNVKRLPLVVLCSLLLVVISCGGSDSTTDSAATSTEVAGAVATPESSTEVEATSAAEPTQVVAGQEVAEPAAPVVPFAGEWPYRFCVDPNKVETTLNLRSEPTTESEVLASIPRASCELIVGGVTQENGFQPVIYTTSNGSIDGWVSDDFVALEDPPLRMEAAALLFVDAWQAAADTGQYSYGIGSLPTPIQNGFPAFVEGPAGFGCVLEGDVTVICAIALVARDGIQIARIDLTGTQRGTNGYDGEPYFAADFPDGPTITSFTLLDS